MTPENEPGAFPKSPPHLPFAGLVKPASTHLFLKHINVSAPFLRPPHGATALRTLRAMYPLAMAWTFLAAMSLKSLMVGWCAGLRAGGCGETPERTAHERGRE